MNDDFEDSLRDSLHRAVPPPPPEASRSEGARAYAARARRRRTGVLAAGAVAVVVAAIAVVPSLVSDGRVTDGQRGNDPVAAPTQTQQSQRPGELLDEPFECPTGAGPAGPIGTSPEGTIPSGAVLARVCAVQQDGVDWVPPPDALTMDVDSVIKTLNELPVAEDRMGCDEDLGPAYVMVFQYPDGHMVQVRGDLYGCKLVSFGALERLGAADALHAYFDALADQRRHARPASAIPTPRCPVLGRSVGESLIPHDLSHFVVAKAIVCAYADYSATALDWAALSQDEVAELTADLQANSGERLAEDRPADPSNGSPWS